MVRLKKSTCKISSHNSSLASSHMWMLWTSLWNTDAPLMLFLTLKFALTAPAMACQLYQLANKSFRAFGLWMGRAFKKSKVKQRSFQDILPTILHPEIIVEQVSPASLTIHKREAVWTASIKNQYKLLTCILVCCIFTCSKIFQD